MESDRENTVLRAVQSSLQHRNALRIAVCNAWGVILAQVHCAIVLLCRVPNCGAIQCWGIWQKTLAVHGQTHTYTQTCIWYNMLTPTGVHTLQCPIMGPHCSTTNVPGSPSLSNKFCYLQYKLAFSKEETCLLDKSCNSLRHFWGRSLLHIKSPSGVGQPWHFIANAHTHTGRGRWLGQLEWRQIVQYYIAIFQ